MRIFPGRAVLDTVVGGRLSYIATDEPVMNRLSVRSAQEELIRYTAAQTQAVLELATLYDMAQKELGEKFATIFAIHAMMLEEQEQQRKIDALIQSQGFTAEWAAFCVGQELEQVFKKMQDPYMQARSHDIRDLTQRMVSLLIQSTPRYIRASPTPVILLTRWVNPSEVMLLDKEQVLGIVVEHENITSHTAILASQRGLPLLAGVPACPELDGCMAVLDGAGQCLRVAERESNVTAIK